MIHIPAGRNHYFVPDITSNESFLTNKAIDHTVGHFYR